MTTGARPSQVYIDGIAQLESPLVTVKPTSKQKGPPSGSFEWYIERAQTLGGEAGELTGVQETLHDESVTYINVTSVFRRNDLGQLEAQEMQGESVVMQNGNFQCLGKCEAMGRIIDLHGGIMTPAFIAVGAPLGLGEIEAEPSTREPAAEDYDFKTGKLPVLTVPSLNFGSKDLK